MSHGSDVLSLPLTSALKSCSRSEQTVNELRCAYAVGNSCKQLGVRVTELDSPTHEVHQRIKHFFIYSRMCGGKVIFLFIIEIDS